MKCALGVVLFAAVMLAVETTPPDKPKPAKTAQTKATAGSSKSGAAKAGSGRASSHGRARGRSARRAPAPSYQLHPDPQRYQQIQQALADRGYFKGAVNGQWADDSVDALKRFQADQKLDNDGKINALTLNGLGLGPKHDGSTAPVSSLTQSGTAPDGASASH